jgi:hypothetical protein
MKGKIMAVTLAKAPQAEVTKREAVRRWGAIRAREIVREGLVNNDLDMLAVVFEHQFLQVH